MKKYISSSAKATWRMAYAGAAFVGAATLVDLGAGRFAKSFGDYAEACKPWLVEDLSGFKGKAVRECRDLRAASETAFSSPYNLIVLAPYVELKDFSFMRQRGQRWPLDWRAAIDKQCLLTIGVDNFGRGRYDQYVRDCSELPKYETVRDVTHWGMENAKPLVGWARRMMNWWGDGGAPTPSE